MPRSKERKKQEKNLLRLIDQAKTLGLYNDKVSEAHINGLRRMVKSMPDTDLRNTINIMHNHIARAIPIRVRLKN